MAGTALILGASGRFGRNCRAAFEAAGWEVRTFRRGGDLGAEAAGADVIVNGWNPPYPLWEAQVPGQIAQVLAASEASGATLLQPGNVYVYGTGAPELLTCDTPHEATNPLGRVRIALEAAVRASEARTILLRGGDFLDGAISGGWFDRVMAARLSKRRFTYPGRWDAPHAFAYLPDMARAAVALAERRAALPPHAEMPFAGYTLTGEELRAATEAAWGAPLARGSFAWGPLALIAPFSPMMRCLREMRYLWDMPHRIDAGPLAEFLPDFHATPLDQAMTECVAPFRGL